MAESVESSKKHKDSKKKVICGCTIKGQPYECCGLFIFSLLQREITKG